MKVREETERIEQQVLSEHATLSIRGRGRRVPETPCDIRTDFQRDRDRILHCKTFRRLKHKTQVFLAPKGDHYRTRLTHTLEVSQIARTIARALRLNEDLTEAIGLGHDLGHTPFGHAGEGVLDRLTVSCGGFRHYFQSVRVVNFLERDGAGLNLTREVVEGIGKHSKGRSGDPTGSDGKIKTLEARVVRISDVVAYLNHDFDDAIRAGIITADDLPAQVVRMMGQSSRSRIDALIRDIIGISLKEGGAHVRMSDEMEASFQVYKDFMYDRIYLNPEVKEEFTKSEKILEFLFEFLMKDPESHIPAFYFSRKAPLERVVADFISGMTDLYAIRFFEDHFIPRRFGFRQSSP